MTKLLKTNIVALAAILPVELLIQYFTNDSQLTLMQVFKEIAYQLVIAYLAWAVISWVSYLQKPFTKKIK